MKHLFPLKNPQPDVENFLKVLKREKLPSRVPFAEHLIDEEIRRLVVEDFLGRKWVPISENRELYYLNFIEFWHRMGYDYIRFSSTLAGISFPSLHSHGEDTAIYSRGDREWVKSGEGVIKGWDDFERFPWLELKDEDFTPFLFISRNLPPGMGLMVSFSGGVLENVMNKLMGLVPLSFLIYDSPELVRAVVDRVGETMERFYLKIIELNLPNLIGFFQGDDMGYRSSTIFSPEFLKEYILPWHERFARIAHENGLIYILHSCGNLEEIMETLIEEVGIDGKHSFEDEIMPVVKFKEKYGDRVAILGGVDVDKLARLDREKLVDYVEGILEVCAKDGGYALGSGNSITNYIPLENYLTMLEVGWRFLG